MKLEEALRLGKAVELVRQFCPKFQVRDKKNSLLHRVIAKISSPWNKEYMSGYWTTFGYTTWRPDNEESEDLWMTIFHEGKHVIQAKKLTRLLFLFLSSLPISLFPVFLMLGFWHWYLMLIAPVFLFPQWPDPFRYRFELKAYAVSLAMDFWTHGPEVFSDENLQWYEDQLDGPVYFYMMPFKTKVRRDLDSIVYDIRTNDVFKDEYMFKVHEFLKDEGMLYNK